MLNSKSKKINFRNKYFILQVFLYLMDFLEDFPDNFLNYFPENFLDYFQKFLDFPGHFHIILLLGMSIHHRMRFVFFI